MDSQTALASSAKKAKPTQQQQQQQQHTFIEFGVTAAHSQHNDWARLFSCWLLEKDNNHHCHFHICFVASNLGRPFFEQVFLNC
jgi:hypothetical protein